MLCFVLLGITLGVVGIPLAKRCTFLLITTCFCLVVLLCNYSLLTGYTTSLQLLYLLSRYDENLYLSLLLKHLWVLVSAYGC